MLEKKVEQVCVHKFNACFNLGRVGASLSQRSGLISFQIRPYDFGTMKIQIRYNTDKDKTDSRLPPWRVLIDGKEHLAEKVILETRSWTTLDEVEPGRLKWHISCDGDVVWNPQKNECIVRDAPVP